MSADLRTRLMAAERAGGLGADAEVATAAVVPVVARRRRVRAAAGTFALVAALALSAVLVAEVGWPDVQPAAPVDAPVYDLSDTPRVDPGALPDLPRMQQDDWAELGPQAALVLWSAGNGQDYALLLTDGGNVRTAATFRAVRPPALLAWDREARVALVVTAGEDVMLTEESELARISLDGGEDEWTATCDATSNWHDSVTGGANVGSMAVPLGNGDFAVSTYCPSEFVMHASGVRTEVDEQAAAALREKAVAVFGGSAVQHSGDAFTFDRYGSSVTVTVPDGEDCASIARERTGAISIMCRRGDSIELVPLTANGPTAVTPPVKEPDAVPYIDGLCGIAGVRGVLGDVPYGVGVTRADTIVPLRADRARVTDCWDVYAATWATAGGDLLQWLEDGSMIRAVDLLDPSADDLNDGAGVVSVLGDELS